MDYSPNMDFLLNDVPSLKGQVSDAEWQTRVDLAACYRLVARYGWDDMLSAHISARVPDETNRLLINPYGVLFSQVTASCLVKTDFYGEQFSETPFPMNPAAIVIHGAILEARGDVASALHSHTTAGVAVSTHNVGLMPINQRALYFQNVLAYHDYEGLALESDERESLVAHLQDKWVMLLRNHGTLSVGRTIGQAFIYAYMLERACEYQVATLAGGTPLVELSDDIKQRVPNQATHFEFAGTMEWPALLALLDAEDSSFRL